VADRRRLVDRRLAEPTLSERVTVCAALLPRSRRRHADEVDQLGKPVPRSAWDALGREPGDQLVVRPWAVRKVVADAAHGAVHVHAAKLGRGGAQVPALAAGPCGEREGPVVVCRNHVDRRAHDRRLDHAPILQRTCQRVPAEVADAAPQADIAGRGVLRLETADRFERVRQAER
jgi:hypothetical protein